MSKSTKKSQLQVFIQKFMKTMQINIFFSSSNIIIVIIFLDRQLCIDYFYNSKPMLVSKSHLCSCCGTVEDLSNKFYYIYDLHQATCQQCYKTKLKSLLKFHQNRKLFPQIVQILPNLYLGNADSSVCPQIIKEYQIDCICACGFYLFTPFEKTEANEALQFNIEYQKVLIGDFVDQDIKQYFQENNSWIENKIKEGKSILVHCSAGVSRSVSFILAYLIGKKGMLFDEAYGYVKQRREEMHPNAGFVKQLQQYSSSKHSTQ